MAAIITMNCDDHPSDGHSGNEKHDPYSIAVGFLKSCSVDEKDTLWFKEGSWYVWTGSHYSVTSATQIDQRILNFLAKQSLPINRPLIGKIRYFLEVKQYIEGFAPPLAE